MESAVKTRGIAQKAPKPRTRFIPPTVFLDALEASVVGQSDMKPKLAYIFSHYTAFLDDPSTGKPLPLLYGPSGAGKTYAIELCCRISDLPLSSIGGAGTSPAGYKGTTLRDLITQHYMDAQSDEGIIYIDEVDKWCRGFMTQYEKADPETIGMNLNKQAECLRYVEHEIVDFTDEAKDIKALKGKRFDTGRTLWIFSGAFVGLDHVVKNRTGQEQITTDDIWEHAEPPDFIRYGMIEEFANRISAWAWVKALDSSEILTILEQQDVPQWLRLFEFIGCKLILDRGALANVAGLALHNKRGPRGAKMYLRRVLGDVYSQAGKYHLTEVKVDGQVMTQGRLDISGI
jgi:ATP-dependent Clp protease ATP-binding subunit ClpX